MANGPPKTSAKRPRTDAEPLRQRLILTLPADLAAARLSSALAAGDVAAVVLPAAAAEGPALVAAAQAAGAAALVSGTGWPAPFGADGLHVDGDVVKRLAARPDGAMCGAVADERHRAMVAGEAGADYLWFDATGDLVTGCALANWWQALFEVPAVVAGPSDEMALAALIGTRAEFVALVDVFGDRHDEVARVAAINRALGDAEAR